MHEDFISENEKHYGSEARTSYGDGVMDAANAKLAGMSPERFAALQQLSADILEKLAALMAAGDGADPTGDEARALCAMHAEWIQGFWPEGLYSPATHLALAEGYLLDHRFTEYYDNAAGAGATEFLVAALREYLQ